MILYNKIDTNQWDGKYDIEKIKFSGFIAQEVAQAAQSAHYDFSGVTLPKDESHDLYSIRMAEFVPALVKAIQEQQETIVNLKQENAALKAELTQKMTALEQKLSILQSHLMLKEMTS